MHLKSNRLGLQNKNRHGEIMTIIAYRGAADIDLELENGVIIRNRTFKNFEKGTIANPTDDRLGKIGFSNKGEKIKIIRYDFSDDIDIQFEDGTVCKNRTYYEFLNRGIQKPEDRVGEKNINCENYSMKIITYRSSTDLDIKFSDGTIITNRTYTAFKKGSISNPYHRSVCGVGYFGIGKYLAKINGKFTKEYEKWSSMIKRCYDDKELEKSPTYKDITVCDKWHNFQVFAEWFENNYKEGFELDKDVLFKGNKIYSPETCCLIPSVINNLLRKIARGNNKYPMGIKRLSSGRFQVRFSERRKRVSKSFDTLEETIQFYKTTKEKRIKELADEWKDKIEPKVYKAMYNWIVEITD